MSIGELVEHREVTAKELATAVEDTSIPMRCLDQLGRYITADESEDRKPIIAAIISLSKRLSDYDAEDVDEYTFHFEADSSNNLLCRYGYDSDKRASLSL